jgi:hypothetical protein
VDLFQVFNGKSGTHLVDRRFNVFLSPIQTRVIPGKQFGSLKVFDDRSVLVIEFVNDGRNGGLSILFLESLLQIELFSTKGSVVRQSLAAGLVLSLDDRVGPGMMEIPEHDTIIDIPGVGWIIVMNALGY